MTLPKEPAPGSSSYKHHSGTSRARSPCQCSWLPAEWILLFASVTMTRDYITMIRGYLRVLLLQSEHVCIFHTS